MLFKLSTLLNCGYFNCDKTIFIKLKNNTAPQTTTAQIIPQRFLNSRQTAFSLIEVTIVLAILSILVSVAVPSFSSTINKSKLSNTSLELISSLSLARQHAITSSKKVHLCALTSLQPTICQQERNFNANWSKGWMVFADINDNNEYDQSDTILSISSNTKTVNVVFNQQGRLRFFPDGSSRSAGFYICSKNSLDNRHIKLLYSGRARATKISNPAQLTTCLSAN